MSHNSPTGRSERTGFIGSCAVLFVLFCAATVFGVPLVTQLSSRSKLSTLALGVVTSVGLVSPLLCPFVNKIGAKMAEIFSIDDVVILAMFAAMGIGTIAITVDRGWALALAAGVGITSLAMAALFASVTNTVCARLGSAYPRARMAGTVGFGFGCILSDIADPFAMSAICFAVILPALWFWAKRLSSQATPVASMQRLAADQASAGVVRVWIIAAVLAAVARPFAMMGHMYAMTLALAPGSTIALTITAEALFLEALARSAQCPRLWMTLASAVWILIYATLLLAPTMGSTALLLGLPLQGANAAADALCQSLVGSRRSTLPRPGENPQAILNSCRTLGAIVGTAIVMAVGCNGVLFPRLWAVCVGVASASAVLSYRMFREFDPPQEAVCDKCSP